MHVPPEHDREFATFPEVLRELVLAELAAGNAIAELGHVFPAAPCGAYIKLVRAVTSRPRESTAVLSFYDRNGSQYSGEFTDAKRHFFVLEPPHPPEPEPDMDAIRAARDARYAAAQAEQIKHSARRAVSDTALTALGPDEAAIRSRAGAPASPAFARFRASMTLDYEKWHDGIGYDLDALRSASPAERQDMETLLIGRATEDWRDVEALAALNTPGAKAALRQAHARGNHAIKVAVMHYAPGLVAEAERTESLIEAIKGADIYGGLSQTLSQVADHHPPAVIDALFRAALHRDGGPAVHCAAMVLFLHGKAESAFDWAHRPFLLRFNATDRTERETIFSELCARVGVDARKYLVSS